MKATITNVRAGDIVTYKSFDGKTTDYQVISKSTSENYVDHSGEIMSKGHLTGRTVTDNDIIKYNNFYCLADGTFPSLTLNHQSHQE